MNKGKAKIQERVKEVKEKWNENVETCDGCGIKWKKIGKQCPVCYRHSEPIAPSKGKCHCKKNCKEPCSENWEHNEACIKASVTRAKVVPSTKQKIVDKIVVSSESYCSPSVPSTKDWEEDLKLIINKLTTASDF